MKPSWPRRAKYLLFAVVGLMMLVVIRKDLLVLIDPDPLVKEHYRPIKWWLLPHAVAGAAALFLGPLQFSERLRRRWLRWHRIVGRIYVCGVGVAAPLGVVIESFKSIDGIGSRALVIANVGFAALFLVTTGIAVLMIRRRRVESHKKWMTRSYATALIFLEVRCVEESPLLRRLLDWPTRMLDAHSISDLWLYIAFAPIAAQLVLWGGKVLKKPVR